MSARGPYRRHSLEFKLQLCSDIRDGKLGRREEQKTHRLSANLIQLWLNQYDNGELDHEEAAASTIAEYEAKIAALERKFGQLTMELDLVKKPRVQGPRVPTSRPCLFPARIPFHPKGVPSDQSTEKHLLLPFHRRRVESAGQTTGRPDW